MSEPADNRLTAAPLDYANTRRRETPFGLIAFGLAAICASLPIRMLWQLFSGKTRKFVVYKPYAADIGVLHLGVNWPWFALDVLALLLGIVGIYLGGRKWSVTAVIVASLSLIGVMTLVLGSPW